MKGGRYGLLFLPSHHQGHLHLPLLGHPEKQFHPLEDEYGNAAPGNIPSCWQKSAEGQLTLEQYILEGRDE